MWTLCLHMKWLSIWQRLAWPVLSPGGRIKFCPARTRRSEVKSTVSWSSRILPLTVSMWLIWQRLIKSFRTTLTRIRTQLDNQTKRNHAWSSHLICLAKNHSRNPNLSRTPTRSLILQNCPSCWTKEIKSLRSSTVHTNARPSSSWTRILLLATDQERISRLMKEQRWSTSLWSLPNCRVSATDWANTAIHTTLPYT